MELTHKVPSRRYYQDLGRAHDHLLRCKDCRRLITYGVLALEGSCPSCGNRKVTEITGLTLWEWLKIRLGFIRFEDRDAFLKEFSPWKKDR